jgi:hypothetical protein
MVSVSFVVFCLETVAAQDAGIVNSTILAMINKLALSKDPATARGRRRLLLLEYIPQRLVAINELLIAYLINTLTYL